MSLDGKYLMGELVGKFTVIANFIWIHRPTGDGLSTTRTYGIFGSQTFLSDNTLAPTTGKLLYIAVKFATNSRDDTTEIEFIKNGVAQGTPVIVPAGNTDKHDQLYDIDYVQGDRLQIRYTFNGAVGDVTTGYIMSAMHMDAL